MKKISLDGEWRLERIDEGGAVAEKYSAIVPGCVHTDLKRAGVIGDIFWRDNAESVQWIEKCTWLYTKEFDFDMSADRMKIVFEGLDVYCDIYVNEKHLAFCDDMFVEHEFSLEGFLKSGRNKIAVKLYPPTAMVKDPERYRGAFTTERLQTRRMQCTYGWDWVQRLVTMGIYKSVYIYRDCEQVCDNAYVYTRSIDKYSAQILVSAEFKNYDEGALAEYKITAPSGEVVYKKEAFCNSKSVRFTVDIKDAELWSVVGCIQPIYKLSVSVGENTYETEFGIRTVKIMKLRDEAGSPNYQKCLELQKTESGQCDKTEEFYSFEVVLNGERVMCKGANWVPCEPFASEETEEKITRILELAKSANVNIVRVWGGGHAEKDWFYRECDRLGIMVVQDFFMACGTYPEDQAEFLEKLRREARDTALRLRNHPSLIWWNADNENAEWGDDTLPDYRGRKSAVFGLYPVVHELDWDREIMASSPWGGKPYRSKTCGTTHNTNFLMEIFKYFENDECDDYKEHFKEFSARFVSEEFTFGAVSQCSLERFMNEKDIFETDDMWLYHSKGNPWLPDEILNYCNSFARKVLGEFEDGEDRLFKRQYIQYEWVRVTMELARRNRGFCGGVVYWMLNDCWPAAMGWSFIDYYCMPKASFYAFKKAAADISLSIDCHDEKLFVYLCNDTGESVSRKVSVRAENILSGETVAVEETEALAEANCVTAVELCNVSAGENTVVFAECEDADAFWKSGALRLEKCDLPKIEEKGEGYIVLSAEKYIHAVELCGDMVFEDNFFALKSGERRKIKYRGDGEIKIHAYTLAAR